MSFSDLAPIADLLAALGVMVTVAVLAYELHQTRRQTELSNWRDLLQTLVDYKGLTNNAEFAEFVERAHEDYDALSAADRRRFGLYLEQGVHIYGNFLKHNDSLPQKLAGLDDAIANSFTDMLTTPGGAAWYARTRGQGHFMPSTYKTIDDVLAAGRKPTDPRPPSPSQPKA
jgi:hypothetical protein